MRRRCSSLLSSLALLLGAVAPLRAVPQDLPGEEPPPVSSDEEPSPADRTPPRLSHIDGQASFWRQGADEWAQARVNTPLAPGDQLYVENASNLELQIGPRDFLRAASNSQLAYDNEESEYQQFRLTSGQASLDLRGLRAGQSVEVDTPNGAFTIDHNGYYRVEVDEDATHFAARRGGRATVTPGSGDPEDISPSEEVVVKGDDVESYAASEPDAWDRWNYDRSDQLVEAVSYRHVPEDVYGVDDLDHSGRWRVVPRYGSVWFPSGVAAGWSPYTTGRWVLDPYYGWTWVDDASWGWAPYHYGRWVFVGDYWGWAPGPIIARPIYAPALVAFFSAGPISIGIGLGTPLLGWTPLGWGEPCRPWWGPANFIGRPRWFGWGGPRVDIHQTVINNINVYQNASARNGVVVVNRNDFARGPVARGRFASADPRRLAAVSGALPVSTDPARVIGGAPRGQRPPQAMLDRRVVATRASAAPAGRSFFRRSDAPSNPAAQLVPSPREARARGALPRPRFGEQAGVERDAPPPPPRFDAARGRASNDPTQGSLQQGSSSTANRAPGPTPGSGATRRGPMRQAGRAPAPQAPGSVQPSQNGGGGRGPQRATTTRRSAPPQTQARRNEPQHRQSPHAAPQQRPAPRLESPRTMARSPASRQQQAGPQRAAPELPGQPANRVWAGRAHGGPPTAAMAPRDTPVPRQASPQRGAQSRAQGAQRMAAEQPAAAQPDAGSRGHERRTR